MSQSDPFHPDRAAEAIEQLSRLSLVSQPEDSVLQTAVELATKVLPGRPEVSITVVVKGRPSTTASSAELALELDERQYERGYGPCLEAAASGERVEIAEMASETRWADYCQIAAARGAGSSLSIPLPLPGRLSGALNIYAREPYAFDEPARDAAELFAPFIAVAVANVHALQEARDQAADLRVALESRAVIDQAKGILMERHGLTADTAFAALAAVSMRTNTKVRDIAQQLVVTGEIDGGADLG